MSTWPRVILQFLFEFPPSDYSALLLASFFYGNGLGCFMALRLVSVCHCGPCDELLHRIQSLYDGWTLSPNVTHLGIYWDMRLQKYVWLNGSNNQLETYGGGDKTNDIEVGFGYRRLRDWMMFCRLYNLRRTALY